MSPGEQTTPLAAMLAVSRGVAESGDLAESLDLIAQLTGTAAGCDGVTIVLLGSDGNLRLGGAWGINPGLRAWMEDPSRGISLRDAPTSVALARRRQVTFAKPTGESSFEFQWDGGLDRGIGSVAATPVGVGEELLGSLNAYRKSEERWSAADLGLLTVMADHAATAARVTGLIDRQNRQLDGFERVLRSLREQTHEHANRIHSIAALVSMGAEDEAERFVQAEIDAYESSTDSVVAGIESTAVAGLLMAEMAVARQRGVDLKVDRRSRLTGLPDHLTEAEAVALVGQLLDCAFDAVHDAPLDRRRITFSASGGPARVVIRVRDWAVRPSSLVRELQTPGTPLDPRDHPSMQQALLARIVDGARGTIELKFHRLGTTTTVVIPG